MATRREFVAAMATAGGMMAAPSRSMGRLWSLDGVAPSSVFQERKPLLTLQQEFIDLRLGMLCYFNMSTFQVREWASIESPANVFAPTALDTDQWARAARTANMTWGCLTVKHHDGFCLWPTATNSVGVKNANAPDIVRAFTDSFRKQGMKVGLHFSMMDQRLRIERFSATRERIAIVKEQLRELLTQYGDVAVIVFDGWNAPWSRIGYSEVPFDDIYQHIKSIQPNCLVCEINSIRQPPYHLLYTDLKAYKWGSGQGLPALGGLPGCAILNLNGTWFWRPQDLNAPLLAADSAVRDWIVPFNNRQYTVLLNAPPAQDGRLAPNLEKRLGEIGKLWKHSGPAARLAQHQVITTRNLIEGRPVRSSETADAYGSDFLNDGDYGWLWAPRSPARDGWAEVDLGQSISVNVVAFFEAVGRTDDYPVSRVARYSFKAWDGSKWYEIASGESPRAGAVRRIEPIRTERLRFEFTGLRDRVWISEIGAYDERDV